MNKSVKTGMFANREELEFFIKNNRFAVKELLESNPEFRTNVQQVLEAEIIGNKINNSSMIQLASSFDENETRHPLTNALMIGSIEGQSFFSFCTDFLKKRVKNPFTKLDDEYIKSYKAIKEEEEEEDLKKELEIKKEKMLQEKENDDNIIKTTRMAFNIESERLREQIKQLTIFIEENRERINEMVRSLSPEMKADLDKIKDALLDVIKNNPKTAGLSAKNQEALANMGGIMTLTIGELAKDMTLEELEEKLKKDNPTMYKALTANGQNLIKEIYENKKNGNKEEEIVVIGKITNAVINMEPREQKTALLELDNKVKSLRKENKLTEEQALQYKSGRNTLKEIHKNKVEESLKYENSILEKKEINSPDVSKLIIKPDKNIEDIFNIEQQQTITQGNKL